MGPLHYIYAATKPLLQVGTLNLGRKSPKQDVKNAINPLDALNNPKNHSEFTLLSLDRRRSFVVTRYNLLKIEANWADFRYMDTDMSPLVEYTPYYIGKI
ncbi:MAG: hypothetical protein BZY81_01920 [SAR202 cluster bacterium Io17-Chloro-G4]|nr:MAG: hypothetical protein BZY81_01920 [SAR202 cluster bacterium Io17-Chloro-G4]